MNVSMTDCHIHSMSACLAGSVKCSSSWSTLLACWAAATHGHAHGHAVALAEDKLLRHSDILQRHLQPANGPHIRPSAHACAGAGSRLGAWGRCGSQTAAEAPVTAQVSCELTEVLISDTLPRWA